MTDMNTNVNPFESLESKLLNIQNSLTEIKTSLSERPKVEQKYYPVAQAARKLNVAEITLYRECKKGRIPSKKIGERVMIPGSYVDGTGN